MTIAEFSDQFDILYNNITSNQAPGLDEYEKSIFLTKAQEEIVNAYFNPMLNKTQIGFDDSGKRQIDFSMLVKSAVIEPADSTKGFAKDTNGFDERAYIIPLYKQVEGQKTSLLEPILVFLNEKLQVSRDNKTITLVVTPMRFDDYDRTLNKPYKRPTKHVAWRLLDNKNNSDTTGNSYIDSVYIIPGSNDKPTKYTCRYVKRPNPIILQDLTGNDVSINGKQIAMTSELDPILHQDIVQRAVELAKATYTGTLADQIQIGNISATNLGIVPKGKE